MKYDLNLYGAKLKYFRVGVEEEIENFNKGLWDWNYHSRDLMSLIL